jgi:hypothetical protein
MSIKTRNTFLIVGFWVIASLGAWALIFGL